MRKLCFIGLAIFLFLASVSAANLEVEKIDKGSVIIAELDNPAVFDLIIDNKGSADNFEIYTLVGVTMSPKGFFYLPSGETRMEVLANPSSDVRERHSGFFTFEYQIKRFHSDIFRDTLQIKIVPLVESINIIPGTVNPDEREAVLTVKNRVNTHLEDLELRFESPFFEGEEIVSLEPYESVNISFEVDPEEIEELTAGPYIVTTEIKLEGVETSFEDIIDYSEKEDVVTSDSSEGFIVRKRVVEKINEGNTEVLARVEIKKDVFSRLFTINSPGANFVERQGLSVTYVWEELISPSESFTIESTTNYTFPFIIVILIVLIAFMTKVYTRTVLNMEKNVSFVRTKSGDFALKVHLHVKARKHVDDVQLIDSLPAMTKVYEGYGKKPDKVDEKTRRLFWNVGKLNKGEGRVFSYIIYSKLRVVGRFELPAATATFEREGVKNHAWSNRAFFVSGVSK